MEVNIDRIKSRFDNKIRKEEIVKIYSDFKRFIITTLIKSHEFYKAAILFSNGNTMSDTAMTLEIIEL